MGTRVGALESKNYESKNVCEIIEPVTRSELMSTLNSILAPLYINNDFCCTVERRIRLSLEWGLNRASNPYSSLKCFPTYVTSLPSGRENCECLAIDLGGTNLRCIKVKLQPGCEPTLLERKSTVPKHIQLGTGSQLFQFVAGEMKQFLIENKLEERNLPLGFTFSFPCRQTGLNSATLNHWTKGFRCCGVEGKDVCQLLSRALRKMDLKVSVVAVLNDTTGALMSCAYRDDKTKIGLILGTGTNACYLERRENIGTVDNMEEDNMIINTEWGAFGENGELDFLRTTWDEELDRNTANPGNQILEKMVGGMYLGELVRIILLDLRMRSVVLCGREDIENVLLEPGSLTTLHICEVESDPVGVFDRCTRVWGMLGVENPSMEDCFMLRCVCEAVSRRCCLLLSAGIAALLHKMEEKEVTVAVDGSLFRYHPHFGRKIEHRVQQLMGADYKFKILMSQDGSGKGAGIIAAALQAQAVLKGKPETSTAAESSSN